MKKEEPLKIKGTFSEALAVMMSPKKAKRAPKKKAATKRRPKR